MWLIFSSQYNYEHHILLYVCHIYSLFIDDPKIAWVQVLVPYLYCVLIKGNDSKEEAETCIDKPDVVIGSYKEEVLEDKGSF